MARKKVLTRLKLKVFKIVGWKQYKGDVAIEFECDQIAVDADSALETVASRFGIGYVYKMTAVEIG